MKGLSCIKPRGCGSVSTCGIRKGLNKDFLLSRLIRYVDRLGTLAIYPEI